MGQIVIKRRVSFDFLGEEYKDAYIIFRSVPLIDLDGIKDRSQKASKENTAGQMILDVLKQYFLEGKFPDSEKLVAGDLDGLDEDAAVKCFMVLTGQEIQKAEQEVEQVADLKDDSATPSSTTETGQTN